MSFETIQINTVGSIVTIVLNRPRALNAINAQMLDELSAVLDQLASDEQVRVVILTGARRAFCFGADFDDLTGETPAETSANFEKALPRFQNVIRKLYNLPQPTIASLNAFAAGAGLDLAMACDIRIASDKVKLSEAFVKMSLVPDGGGTWSLPRIVGYPRAAELVFTGEPIDANEASYIGLVNRVVPAVELEETVNALASRIAAAPGAVVRRAKQLLKANSSGSPSESLDDALGREAIAQLECIDEPAFAQILKDRRKKE